MRFVQEDETCCIGPGHEGIAEQKKELAGAELNRRQWARFRIVNWARARIKRVRNDKNTSREKAKQQEEAWDEIYARNSQVPFAFKQARTTWKNTLWQWEQVGMTHEVKMMMEMEMDEKKKAKKDDKGLKALFILGEGKVKELRRRKEMDPFPTVRIEGTSRIAISKSVNIMDITNNKVL
ncbi:hypothetical protein AAMO2058_001155100 [Amorphochlora amoebiformis]